MKRAYKMHPMEISNTMLSTEQQEQTTELLQSVQQQQQLQQQLLQLQQQQQQQQPLLPRLDDAPEYSSNYSRSCSYNYGNTNSAPPGTPSIESESNIAPVSVRDMIKRYNSASQMDKQHNTTPLRRQSQFNLFPKKSSWSMVKRDESDDDAGKTPRSLSRRCSNCKMYENCMRPPTSAPPERGCCRTAMRCNSSGGESENSCSYFAGDSISKRCSNCEINESKELPNVLKQNLSKARNCRSSIDSMEDVTCQPVEASYQSKTTIAKTASGVRIIIDIFFDQEQNVAPSDVIGSRVETDIPQSRILSEFQQQSMQAARTQN